MGQLGADGAPGSTGPPGERGPMGTATPQPSDPSLEPLGLVGSVHDPSGRPIAAGDIYLVPAADVAALAMQPLDLSLPPEAARTLAADEPLEDLLDAHAASYPHATLAADGNYRFEEVGTGSYFVVFRPAAGDSDHLPGGSACRAAVDSASLLGTRLDIRVSGRPSNQANYIGSSACITCHGRQRSARTAHRVSLQAPGARGAYQDVSPWGYEFDAALRAYDAGKTLYFYDCDAAREGDAKCLVSDIDPSLASTPVAPRFELRMTHSAMLPERSFGAYTAEFRNREALGTASYPVALSYGGPLGRQQYIVRRANPNGSYSYFVLPFQFNAQGSLLYADPDDWPYRDVRSDQWFDFTTGLLKPPDNRDAFDNNCAGCHLTGMQLQGDANAGFSARPISDANGDFDYDADGRLDEINTGCEACHGPGSEHVEATPRGLRIVSPSLVTPERELMICGGCHSRPQGKGGGGTQAPLSETGSVALAGLRRSEFIRDFTTRVDAPPEGLHPSGDSRWNHQQSTDFLRSSMARNGRVLMTCSNCHDAHGNDDNAHMLRKASTDNGACTGCHSSELYTSVRGHVEKATGFIHDGSDAASLACTTCHMVQTVAAGARHPELRDFLPRDAPEIQYMHGDIASHRFSVTRRAQAAQQPVAATLVCAFCHNTLLDNP